MCDAKLHSDVQSLFHLDRLLIRNPHIGSPPSAHAGGLTVQHFSSCTQVEMQVQTSVHTQLAQRMSFLLPAAAH